MYCKECGNKLEEKEKFCANCGAKVKDDDKGEKKRKNTISQNVHVVVMKEIGNLDLY